MFRTIRCLVMVTLLSAVAAPAAQAQEIPANGGPVESPSLWTGILSWVSPLFTGGGPFIDPNGGSRTIQVDGAGGRLAQEDGRTSFNPAG